MDAKVEMIEKNILNYITCLNDEEYLGAIVNSASAVQLCNIINALLESEDTETVSSTCLFIRDLVLSSSRQTDCEKFVESPFASAIVSTIESLLFSPNHFIRQQAVYTLGKTCSYDSIAALDRAFTQFRDSDPLLLPRLIGEMGWLGAENLLGLLDSMISSPVYMTRWAVMSMVDEFVGDDPHEQDGLFQTKWDYMEQLRQDSNSLIHAEAEYNYQLFKTRREIYNLPRKERKNKLKTIDRQYKPEFSFFGISNRFTGYLYNQKSTNYSIDELEYFIDKITQSKT